MNIIVIIIVAGYVVFLGVIFYLLRENRRAIKNLERSSRYLDRVRKALDKKAISPEQGFEALRFMRQYGGEGFNAHVEQTANALLARLVLESKTSDIVRKELKGKI